MQASSFTNQFFAAASQAADASVELGLLERVQDQAQAVLESDTEHLEPGLDLATPADQILMLARRGSASMQSTLHKLACGQSAIPAVTAVALASPHDPTATSAMPPASASASASASSSFAAAAASAASPVVLDWRQQVLPAPGSEGFRIPARPLQPREHASSAAASPARQAAASASPDEARSQDATKRPREPQEPDAGASDTSEPDAASKRGKDGSELS